MGAARRDAEQRRGEALDADGVVVVGPEDAELLAVTAGDEGEVGAVDDGVYDALEGVVDKGGLVIGGDGRWDEADRLEGVVDVEIGRPGYTRYCPVEDEPVGSLVSGEQQLVEGVKVKVERDAVARSALS